MEPKVRPREPCPFDQCPFCDQIKQQAEEIEGYGQTIDHIMNTLDVIILPTQKLHAEAISRHEEVTKEANLFMAAWSGAWMLLQRVGIVLAAGASVATFIMKMVEAARK